jgi:hypothetical protein
MKEKKFDNVKARKLLKALMPVSFKRVVLMDLKDDIMQALDRGNSIRGIHKQLKEAGFTGSVMMVSEFVKENGGISSRSTKSLKSKKTNNIEGDASSVQNDVNIMTDIATDNTGNS